ncbi:MAG: cytochrome c-type biogenesis CcmF C-terminal domain-containing protein, partial [Rickettsiales bacterium]
MRPWGLAAWSFLSAGIGLGSWWAYRELGWGGWWFWDPVENVSLLPWLSGTALIHCLLVLSRREALKHWTLLLAIFTFTFSLLGTFLVRSGILSSVHSFANDPARGLYILGFVTLLTGGGLWLYAMRHGELSASYKNAPDFAPVSREGAILLNNLLLTTLCSTVLLGILYPMVLQLIDAPAISVGAPYYNTVFLPISLPLLLLAGLGPLLQWKKASWQAMRKQLLYAFFVAVTAMAMLWLGYRVSRLFPADTVSWMSILGYAAGLWLLGGGIAYAIRQQRLKAHTPASWGMVLAHLGLALLALGITANASGKREWEETLSTEQPVIAGGVEARLIA